MADRETLIRLFEASDESAVAELWYRVARDVYTFLPAWRTLSLESARGVFREAILSRCELWVGTDKSRIVAFLALRGSYVDRLYVDPSAQRQGWGRRLLDHAKKLRKDGLELHTHQQNHGARAFYERNGFVPVEYGVSPPPESVPDVEYHWRPPPENES